VIIIEIGYQRKGAHTGDDGDVNRGANREKIGSKISIKRMKGRNKI